MISHPWKPTRTLTAGFFFASAGGLVLSAALSLLTGGPSETAILLGLSAERLSLLCGTLVVLGGLVFLGIQTLRGNSAWSAWAGPGEGLSPARRLVVAATALAFALSWWAAWTPAERFGELYYYVGRIYPFIVWLACASGAGLVLVLANRFGLDFEKFRAFLRERREAWLVAALALPAFGLITWMVSARVVGMSWRDEDFWYGAGVPLLPLQVLLTVCASIAWAALANRFPIPRQPGKKYVLDLIVFAAIWAIAAWLWANAPVNPDFFITKPVAPNFELYPDYDARFFDLVSQFALIGRGLNNNQFFDRPLYSALLVYLHAAAGQNYVSVMNLQAALFAIFPALGYLLGKRLHSRAAGAGLAILFTLRGINSIEIGTLINTGHPKQMLTDFPSAILMLVLTILAVRWLQDPWKNWISLGLAGGVAGLATLVRPHPLIYFALFIPIIVWVYRNRSRVWFSLSILLVAAALAGILPWLENNGQGRSIADLYLQRIRDVIQQRYPNLQLPGSSDRPAPQEVAVVNLQGLRWSNAAGVPAEKSVLAFSVDNFLNNLTTAVQILPYTPYYQDLEYTVKKSEDFWRPYWNGSMSPWAWVMLPVNLILIALGLGTAWKRARMSGLLPLIVLLGYFAMNALARTSGGRYLVPVDWVVILYYFLGILTVIEAVCAFSRPAFFNQAHAPSHLQSDIPFNRRTGLNVLGVLGLFVLIGALIPLSGKIYPPRYAPQAKKQLAQQISSRAAEQLNVSSLEFNQFVSNPLSVVAQGRLLYPRQFAKDQGLAVSIYPFYRPLPYPRTIFTLLGPKGETDAVFPSAQGFAIQNASDAIILGCRQNQFVQVWGILAADGRLITRTPASPLACPLPAPVCDNNHHCK